MRWEFVEKFGWSLEYIDGLSYGEIDQYYAIVDGRSKAISYLQKKMGALTGKKKRR